MHDTSVGSGAGPGLQAVSPQSTNDPAVGDHYFTPVSRLLCQPQSCVYTIRLYGSIFLPLLTANLSLHIIIV